MTPTRRKDLTLASRLCPPRAVLPSVLPHCRAGRRLRREAPRAAERLRAAAASGRCRGVTAPRTRNARDPGGRLPADRIFGVRAAANRARWAPGGGASVTGSRPPLGEKPAFGVPGARRCAAGRHFPRARCCFWRWAAGWRPAGGSAGRGRRRGLPSRSEASGRPSRGAPPAAPRGRSAAGALGGGLSGVPCQRRSASEGLRPA